MPLKEQLAAERQRWKPLTVYQKFEHAVILVLTALIAVVIGFALWNLVLKILLSIISSSGFDPTDYAVFQAFFGMIFTVIIALPCCRRHLRRQHSGRHHRRAGREPGLDSVDRHAAIPAIDPRVIGTERPHRTHFREQAHPQPRYAPRLDGNCGVPRVANPPGPRRTHRLRPPHGLIRTPVRNPLCS